MNIGWNVENVGMQKCNYMTLMLSLSIPCYPCMIYSRSIRIHRRLSLWRAFYERWHSNNDDESGTDTSTVVDGGRAKRNIQPELHSLRWKIWLRRWRYKRREQESKRKARDGIVNTRSMIDKINRRFSIRFHVCFYRNYNEKFEYVLFTAPQK